MARVARRPTGAKLRANLQALEAARSATHHLFAPRFPALADTSLLLVPEVQQTLAALQADKIAASSAKTRSKSAPSSTRIAPSTPKPSSAATAHTASSLADLTAAENAPDTGETGCAQAARVITTFSPSTAKDTSTAANNVAVDTGSSSTQATRVISRSNRYTARSTSRSSAKNSTGPATPSLRPQETGEVKKPRVLPAPPGNQKKKEKEAPDPPSLPRQARPRGKPPARASGGCKRDPRTKLHYESSEHELDIAYGDDYRPLVRPLPRQASPRTAGATAAPKPRRRLSESSSDSPLALRPAPPPQRKKPKPCPPRDPPLLSGEHAHLLVPAPPLYDSISVFAETRRPDVRVRILEALRRDHPYNGDIEDVLAGLEVPMQRLTGPDGELGTLGSADDLTACVAAYLEYWAREGVAGFPMAAMKVSVWLASIPGATATETGDIAWSFDRLARALAGQAGPAYVYPRSFLDAPLWRDFCAECGRPAALEPPLDPASHEEDPAACSPSASTSEGPLSSLHPPSPLVDSSLLTLAALFPAGQPGLPSPPKLARMDALASPDLQALLTPESYRQLCRKRDAIGSLEHRKFLQHLHRFLHLLS
ncbi:hypothetical protein PTTG_28443 [Puccinia triticina 1-1 BBBD Race 1]|uniref:Uncharacterized protein n=1 Tax=Puccinia triticina (isolate 1-1 / race 1 (BBBD)) TaxID=630390 RepID=A0A180GBH9_PUCT1|nr:hypothetical protein PTTG_28443 [Puccinia triticina 1-1 BBBD Race 1]